MATTTTLPQCKVCSLHAWNQTLDLDSFPEIFLESFDEVATSALAGCIGCKILNHAWTLVVPDEDAKRRKTSNLCFNAGKETLYLHFFNEEQPRIVDFEVYTLSGEPSFKHIKVANHLPPSTDLSYSLPRIQSWLRSCEEQHPKCRKKSDYIPTRLLEISLQDSEFVRLVRLPPTANDAPRYACLSHCWGHTRSKHITRASNLSANLAGIPIAELPRTFQDAIEIARSLDLQYLWIDSLCIIQDSKSDWAKHVDIMADIYENAFITLAAGASKDDDGGFFAEDAGSDGQAAVYHHLELSIEEKAHKFYFRYCIDHPDAGWPARETLPLMSRGWCLQERLLARRFLCFGSSEILWECLEDVACSCTIADGPFNPRSDVRRVCFPNCPNTKAKMYSSQKDPLEIWHDLVYQYSCRKLTFSSDKLPALAGLAALFEKQFSMGEYRYGMWLQSLHRNIAWKFYGDEVLHGRPRKGPSWSWAFAADGRIEWPSFLSPEISDWYTVHGLQEEKDSKDRTSIVPLSISGILLPVSVQTNAELDSFEESFPLSRHCNVREYPKRHSQTNVAAILRSGLLVEPFPGSKVGRLDRAFEAGDKHRFSTHGTFVADYRYWSSEVELQQTLQHAIFFALGVERESAPLTPYHAASGCWVAGILLKASNNMTPTKETVAQYERIGWLRYCTQDEAKDFKPNGTRTKFLLV